MLSFMVVEFFLTLQLDAIVVNVLTEYVNFDALLQGSISEITLMDAIIYSSIAASESMYCFTSNLQRPSFESGLESCGTS
jgi:hypothetical protein